MEMILASPRGGEPTRRGLILATASTEHKWTGVSGQTCPPLPCKGPGARTVRRSKVRQKKVAKQVVAERCPFSPTPPAGRSPSRGASIPLPGMWAGPVAVWGPPPTTMPPSSCHSLRAPRGFQNKTHTSYPIWWSSVSPSPSTCHPALSSCPRAFAHLVFCLEHRPPCWLGAGVPPRPSRSQLNVSHHRGPPSPPSMLCHHPTFLTQKWHNLIFCGLHLSLREPLRTENLQVLTLLHQLLALRSCQINIRGGGDTGREGQGRRMISGLTSQPQDTRAQTASETPFSHRSYFFGEVFFISLSSFPLSFFLSSLPPFSSLPAFLPSLSICPQ